MDIERINALLAQGYSHRRIARDLGVGRNTLRKYARYRENPGMELPGRRKLESYVAQIREWVEGQPGLRAMDVFRRVQGMGYAGGYDLVKKRVHALRLENLRASAQPGLQAEADFGRIQAGPWDCFLFSLTLTYSGKLFVRLTEGHDMDAFLECHDQSFRALGGVPKEIVYRRQANPWMRKITGTRLFNLPLQRFADHYGFVPREAPPRAPWVVGRLKRPLFLVRSLFLNHLGSACLEDANAALQAWVNRREESVLAETGAGILQKFAAERPQLRKIPEYPLARTALKLVASGT